MQALDQHRHSWLMSPQSCWWEVGCSVWFALCTFSGVRGALWCLAEVIRGPTDSFGSSPWQLPPLFVTSKCSVGCGSLQRALTSGWDSTGGSHCSRWDQEFGEPEAAPEQRCGQRPVKVREPRECGTGGPLVQGSRVRRLSRQEGRAGATAGEAGA